MRIHAKMPNTRPVVPLITFVKYNIPTKTARMIRMALSAEPIFFFITLILFIDDIIYRLPGSAVGFVQRGHFPGTIFLI
jgi:hypothetical protein